MISQSSSRTRKYRTASAQFGDGYSQEAALGINDSVDEWTIAYEVVDNTERDTIWAALDTVKSSLIFNWQAPGDSTVKKWKVTADGVAETPLAGNLWTITFKLRQVFGS